MSSARISAEKLAAIERAFRSDRGLSEQPAFEQWLHNHGMSAGEFAELIENEALLHDSALTPSPFPHRWMIDWLRITDRYKPIVAAAVQKKTVTAEDGDELDAEAATEALLQWYMERLDSSNDAANAASRAMMGYLRNDWEDFLSSLAKRHRAQQQVTGS